ncbi:MAG: NusG domain II-containing protein [Solobacterium sp.]|nr:NusG domain II-containing protein [Solobacterium sp.]
MKKTEKIIIAVLLAASLLAVFLMKNPFWKKEPEILVTIEHQGKVIYEFDPAKDAVYHVHGSYGELDVEVKDGKYRVTNETCPNHICANMGWVSPEEELPIVCMPNEVIVLVKHDGNE